MDLKELGWDGVFEQHFEPFQPEGFVPARIAVLEKQTYLVYGEFGESQAKLAGKFRYQIHANLHLPSVGDWVVLRADATQFTIQALLPRKNSLTRRLPSAGGAKVRMTDGRATVVAGSTQEQVLAANVDTALIVLALNGDCNLRRIERFLTFLHNRSITPVIVLNKADLCADIASQRDAVQRIVHDLPVYVVSALACRGLEVLEPYLAPGKTVVLLGSSGVGKSTLINTLLGEERQKTGAVNDVTGRGRHVTTHRELVVFPTGGMLIDSPGIRALRLWAEEEDIHDIFTDIEELFRRCHFRNCTHTTEAGCAVQEALANGNLDPHRYKNYCKQTREVRYLDHRKQEKYHRDLKIWRRETKAKDEARIGSSLS